MYACQAGLLAGDAIALFKQFYSRQNVKGEGKLILDTPPRKLFLRFPRLDDQG